LKPEERKTCHNIYHCELPQNCKEVKRLKSTSEDGEYFLLIKGKLLKIFCAGMQSDHPKEYITLVHGDSENFSEVYGHRLHNPTECPYNGSRRDDCQCRKDYTAAGFSSFQKIRIDLTTMQIITTDLQFARTSEGHPVPFATAGDCYSAAKCPQGRFTINLYGTGLSLTESARWISQGNYAVSDIKKSPVRLPSGFGWVLFSLSFLPCSSVVAVLEERMCFPTSSNHSAKCQEENVGNEWKVKHVEVRVSERALLPFW